MREIKIVVDNVTGCEFALDGAWFMPQTDFAPHSQVDSFHSSAVLHFQAPLSQALGGAVRFWERLPVAQRRHRRRQEKVDTSAEQDGRLDPADGSGARPRKEYGRQLCIAFGSPHPDKEYQMLEQEIPEQVKSKPEQGGSSAGASSGSTTRTSQGKLSPLALNLRNEWARAAQQAGDAPFTLLVGPCDGHDGLGTGEGMVGQQTCRWEVVAEEDDSTIVRLRMEGSNDVTVRQKHVQQSGKKVPTSSEGRRLSNTIQSKDMCNGGPQDTNSRPQDTNSRPQDTAYNSASSQRISYSTASTSSSTSSRVTRASASSDRDPGGRGRREVDASARSAGSSAARPQRSKNNPADNNNESGDDGENGPKEHVLTPEQIAAHEALQQQMALRMADAEEVADLIKETEVDINRLRDLDDNGKSDIILAFALCAAQQLAGDLAALLRVVEKEDEPDQAGAAVVVSATANASSSKPVPATTTATANTPAASSGGPSSIAITSSSATSAGKGAGSAGKDKQGSTSATSPAGSIASSTSAGKNPNASGISTTVQNYSAEKSPSGKEKFLNEQQGGSLPSKLPANKGVTSSSMGASGKGFAPPSRLGPAIQSQATEEGESADSAKMEASEAADVSSSQQKDELPPRTSQESIIEKGPRPKGAQPEGDALPGGTASSSRNSSKKSHSGMLSDSSGSGSEEAATSSSSSSIDGIVDRHEEAILDASRSPDDVLLEEDEIEPDDKSSRTNKKPLNKMNSQAQQEVEEASTVSVCSTPTAASTSATAASTPASTTPRDKGLVQGKEGGVKSGPSIIILDNAATPSSSSSSRRGSSSSSSFKRNIPSGGGGGKTSAAGPGGKGGTSAASSQPHQLPTSSRSGPARVPAEWMLAENAKSIARFRKVLIRKHLGLLQGLQEALQLGKTQYEPLVEVYRNCVHMNESIEFRKILVQRFSSGKQRLLIVRDLIAALLLSGLLDARCRVIMFRVAARGFDVSVINCEAWERDIGGALFKILKTDQSQVDNSSKYWKVAGGVIGGGLLLGLTGGLAAPAVSVGLGAIGSAVAGAGAAVGLGAAGTAVAGTLGGVGVFLSSLGTAGAVAVFGTIGAGLTGVKLGKRFGDLAEFVFVPMSEERKITSISGFGNFHYIQRLQLFFADGRLVEYGDEDDGTVFDAFCLDADEYLVKVEGYFSEPDNRKNLGYRLEFTTNKGRLGKFATTGSYLQLESTIWKSKQAPPREQIVGLKFRRNRLQGLETEPITATTAGESGAVQLVVFVSGWLKEESQVTETWRRVAAQHFPKSDHFSLRWETAQLMKLGSVLSDTVKSYVGEAAANLWVRATVATVSVSAAYAIVWPWYVVSFMKDLDHEWAVIKERAKLAGQALANAIADRQALGQRPVVLVGHSMGARVIYYCLQELHALGAFHCVMHAVLLGTPCSPKGEGWERARQVVSGRLINGYITSDWILGFLYRYMEWKIAVAGLGPVTEAQGVENHDLSDLVQSHDEYPRRMDEIFTRLKFY
ncbi:unnamed protein product [Amoebophrya sp. A25]|nr:unnamed protein product [Amoebophrya sp. A25]|eukprot:GSA25T00003178001.1